MTILILRFPARSRIEADGQHWFIAVYSVVVLQHHDFFPYKNEQQRVNAIRWNPHHHRRMHLASAKGRDVIVWHLEDTASPSGVRPMYMV